MNVLCKSALRMFLAAAALLAGTTASASYVLYYRVIGDWTVLCGEDSPNQGRRCSLSAPPPTLDLDGATNELIVEEDGDGIARIVAAVRVVPMSGVPALLRVDAFEPHQTPIADGRAVWAGPEAEAILEELASGELAVLRIETATGSHDTSVSLATFGQALETYRQIARAQGLR